MSKIVVLGAGGFIGNHLVNALKLQGHTVVGADLKFPEFSSTQADVFHIADLRDVNEVDKILNNDVDEVYQLAADMGGAGYIFTGDNDSNILHNSSMINLNVLDVMARKNLPKVFYSSSACIYPGYRQTTADIESLPEASAYPAEPDSEYGWEKLFSERLYITYAKNYNIQVRIARLHNVFGPLGTWQGGREKAPAALCRKVATAQDGIVEIWGPGDQTRSFLYIDECITGIQKIMNGKHQGPINLGSDRKISVNDLALLIAQLNNKKIELRHVEGPTGVKGRNSDNTLIKQLLGWAPANNLEYGLVQTYNWILTQL